MSSVAEPRHRIAHSRVLASAVLLFFGAQMFLAVQALRAEFTQLAVNARVERWQSQKYVPTAEELEQAVEELDRAIARAPRWAELYELRARLALQVLNKIDLAVETLDEAVAVAREDLSAAAALVPTLPRLPLQQVGLDSLMYLAGGEQYRDHAAEVFRLASTSRLYLVPLLSATISDWSRLDEATLERTLASLDAVASADLREAQRLLRNTVGRDEICELVSFEC